MKKNILNTIFFTVLIFSSGIAIKAQNYTVSGIIEDAKTGEALIGASIYDDFTKISTISNNYGFFSISLKKGSVSLHFSYLGYKPKSLEFNLLKDTALRIDLDGSITLEEVTIKFTDPGKKINSTQMGMIEIPVKKLSSIPFILGEPDILKAIQLMPGIQSGNEGTSGIFVRGGSPDQNLFLLDGVPVYNANHLFGFFSVFNTDAIRNVSVIKGGFPARYGGRLSSVVDIRMKEGNNKEFHGEGSLGLISSKLSLEGPLIKDKTSFIISARRTYLDVLAQPIVKAVDDFATARYYFYDVNAKINHTINEKNKVFLSLYLGDDVGFFKMKDKYIEDEIHYTLQNKIGLQWGNITTALRWNSVLSSRLFCNTTLTYSKYRFKVYETDKKETKPDKPSANSSYQWDFFSGIQDYSVRTDFDYFLSPKHSIRFGGSYTYHNFVPGTNTYDYRGAGYADKVDTVFGDPKLLAHEMDLYLEDDFEVTDKLKMNVGLHASSFIVRSKNFASLQPRFSGRYLITNRFSVKGSVSNMKQYIHLLTNTSISLPTDLWLPATDLVVPENSWQYSLGTVFPISKKMLFTLEGFYKTMDNIIEYKEGYTFLKSQTNWETMVETGKGWAYGLELLLEKSEGRTTGWIGYTLSWSNRQLEIGNNGQVFPFKYDRRNDISIVVTHKLSDKIDIGATWVFGSGTALTLPKQKYLSGINLFGENENTVQEIEYYKGRNGFRMPAYHRLDLSVNFHKQLKRGERTFSLGLYNAYNRKNPFYVYIGKNTDFYGQGTGEPVVKQVSLFPIIPFINYSFKF